ncbi:recombinase family protein [bacterium]|jgi:site-specific DNA recombinase|nr:recombinase family protein [bacterium]
MIDMTPVVVALYIRVSTDRQAKEGDSLEEQESELKKFCDFRNYRIHQIYIEKGKSGGNTNRPEYKKLVADIEAKKITAVVVKKLDRLSRSLLDFEQLMTTMQRNDVEFISLRENFDTTTAMGKAMLRVALVFAQLEREQTAERIKDVFAWRAEQGLYNGGTRPFGYDSVSSELIPHKQEKKIIQFIFETFIKTKSTTIVANECNVMGFRNRNGAMWDKRQLHKILNHPVYLGKIRWNSQIFTGIHQPLVSELLFNQAQTIFSERKVYRKSKIVLGLLKGVLFCGECHHLMTPNYTKKKNGKIYRYYRCVSTLNPKGKPCINKYFNMEKANKIVLQKVLSCATEQQLQNISNHVEKKNDEVRKELTVIQIEIEGMENMLESIKSKKETYLDSLISNQFVAKEREMINSKIDEFTLQEKQLKGSIMKLQFEYTQKEEQISSVERLKKELVFFKINSQSLETNELKKWLLDTIERIEIFKDETVVMNFKGIALLV